jgi:TetR/AcrR family transcriptional regulator
MDKSERKEREFNLRREEILKQAEEVFAAKGFYKATVMEIAEASGFAVGTIYQYFGSKEELFSSMVTEKLEILYGGIREAVAGKEDAVEKIRALVKANFLFVENNVSFCNIFIRRGSASLAEGTADLREKMIADYLEHVDFIAAVISEGVKSGILKQQDSRLLAFVLAGMINSFVLSWMKAQERGSLSDLTETLLAIFFEGVKSSAA